MKLRSRYSQLKPIDLFDWADSQRETRQDLPKAYRRVAMRARISDLHAIAFCEANRIGGVQQ